MIVGGPNNRKDFHLEEGEELFIQLQGKVDLDILERGKIRRIPIEEGEVFLLPARVPHSPQRYAESIGLVFERRRRPGEMDGLIWYQPNQPGQVLYEEYFHCTDLGTQLKPIIERFFASEEHRTNIPRSSTLVPPVAIDSSIAIDDVRHPRKLSSLISLVPGKMHTLWDSEFTFKSFRGPGIHRISAEDIKDSFLWYRGVNDFSSSSTTVGSFKFQIGQLVQSGELSPESVHIISTSTLTTPNTFADVCREDFIEINIPANGLLIFVCCHAAAPS